MNGALLTAIAGVLVVLPVADWTAFVILFRASRQHPKVVSLRERSLGAGALAIGATGAGFLGLDQLLGLKLAPASLAISLLAVALILMSMPALRWLWIYWRKGF